MEPWQGRTSRGPGHDGCLGQPSWLSSAIGSPAEPRAPSWGYFYPIVKPPTTILCCCCHQLHYNRHNDHSDRCKLFVEHTRTKKKHQKARPENRVAEIRDTTRARKDNICICMVMLSVDTSIVISEGFNLDIGPINSFSFYRQEKGCSQQEAAEINC